MSSAPSTHPPQLQREAIDTLANLLGSLCEAGVSVDADSRITWLSDAYRRLLGIPGDQDVNGRPVLEIIPNSLLPEVIRTGRPIPVDLMQFEDRWLVVMRTPLRDADERVTGAVGFVLYDQLDYLKPLVSKLTQLESRLAEARQLLATGRAARHSLAQIVGTSAAISRTKRHARRAAQNDSTVLLLGETGTGKELLAQAIHNASRRAAKPFVSVNLAAIPETLLESELFGVAAGAYTGATGRDGKFKLSDGGTLFLDEVSELPLHMQAKLLRALQEQEIEPLGSNRVQRLDLRVIAATNHDLEGRVAAGKFRADLFYRLNVLPLTLPPLRERTGDLATLCEALLDGIGAELGVPPPDISSAAIAHLALHTWPGNVRELRNVLERAVALSDDASLDAHHFADIVPIDGDAAHGPGTPTLAEARRSAERRAIEAALDATDGHRVKAAKLLGISRATLYEKLAQM